MSVSTDHEALRKDMEYIDRADNPGTGCLSDLEEVEYRLHECDISWDRYCLWLTEEPQARREEGERIANKILWGIG